MGKLAAHRWHRKCAGLLRNYIALPDSLRAARYRSFALSQTTLVNRTWSWVYSPPDVPLHLFVLTSRVLLMQSKVYRLVAMLLAVSVFQLACYSKHTISTDQLEQLESGNIAESVTIDSDSGPIRVSATTPVQVRDVDGVRYSVSPFNFALGDRQLVAPDYDLLLPRDRIADARVAEFAKGRTIGLIVGSLVAAGGAFALVSLLAGSDDGVGGE